MPGHIVRGRTVSKFCRLYGFANILTDYIATELKCQLAPAQRSGADDSALFLFSEPDKVRHEPLVFAGDDVVKIRAAGACAPAEMRPTCLFLISNRLECRFRHNRHFRCIQPADKAFQYVHHTGASSLLH